MGHKVEMVRVNTRISSSLNDWLDKVSLSDGIPKSTLVMLAIEQYRQQKEAVSSVNEILVRLDGLERSVKPVCPKCKGEESPNSKDRLENGKWKCHECGSEFEG